MNVARYLSRLAGSIFNLANWKTIAKGDLRFAIDIRRPWLLKLQIHAAY